MRPIIGITMNTRTNFTEYYVSSIDRAGGCPLILSRVFNIRNLDAILGHIDGMIFSGGTDIDPYYYNESPLDGLGVVHPYRDEFEFKLLGHCLDDYSFPILGICRGFQLLNIYHGGSLYQSLERKDPSGIKHWLLDTYPLEYPSHMVNIEKESRLYSLLEKTTLGVNSLHHQGIKEIGEGLKSLGHAPDGIVEVLEREGERFVLGVQWHPEMMSKTCEDSKKLFSSFVEECMAKPRKKTLVRE